MATDAVDVAYPVAASRCPTERPRYRNWRQGEPAISQREYARTVIAVAEMVLEDVGEDPDCWLGT